ncbi:uncharacterized protein LOC115878300 [Sitophilus oryzae]|uniref:Uncharacterized protein LOC115878300 n=1 Tax=Sitophilus oryzae TaxID=7048 RepID=A0A6J2XHM3_SITOR|nr:uncharacterized protein LOC115878300 [Sitophilus oryzae]
MTSQAELEEMSVLCVGRRTSGGSTVQHLRRAVSDEHGERFHQDILTVEQRYQGRWNPTLMGDYCWFLVRESDQDYKQNNRGGAGGQAAPVRNRRDDQLATDDDPAPNNGLEPARSVLQDIRPTTTLAGKARQRMKWTDEINKNLLLCYFTVTNLQQNTTGYRSQLYEAFMNIYPELREMITEQRLSDQIRVIIQNNRISPTERETIRRQAAEAIQNEDEPQAQQSASPTSHPQTITPETPETHTMLTNTQSSSAESSIRHTQHETLIPPTDTCKPSNQIDKTFNELYAQYQGANPSSRPFITRPQNTQNIKNTIAIINKIIGKRIEESNSCLDIEEILTLVYCGAATTMRTHEQKNKNNDLTKTKAAIPPWQHRLQKKIATLRKEIGVITQHLKGNLKKRPPQNILPDISSEESVVEILDTKKQQLQAQAKRLKRYKKSHQRKQEKQTLTLNEKVLQISRNNGTANKQSTINYRSKNFWENIWSQAVEHNREAQWITEEENKQINTTAMPNVTITLEDIKAAISKTNNWKAPGDDKIQNYWLKSFTSIHKPLTNIFQNFVQGTEAIPSFLTQGVTYLKPKGTDTANPSKYRPITCLSTTYKLLTAIITTKINTHLQNNNHIRRAERMLSGI